MKPTPAPIASLGVPGRYGSPARRTAPLSIRRRPNRASTHSERPAPDEPGKPQNFARSDGERNVLDPRRRSEMLDLEHRSAAPPRASSRRAVRIDVGDLAADHQPHQFGRTHVRRRRRVRDHAAFAENRDPVGDLENLLETMRDEDERLSLLDKQPHHVEQPVHLVGREGCSRLVEDDDPGVDRQRLQNLDHLALARREVAQDRAQRQVPALAKLVEQRVRARASRLHDSLPGAPNSGR